MPIRTPFRWSAARRIAATALLLAAIGRPALAHNVAPEPTVEVFLRTTGDHLAVKVWLPIVALADANLPRTSDGHFVAGEIGPALDLVARGIGRDLELQQGDEPLLAPSLAITLSPDESFVALDLDFLVTPGRADLSGRFHTFRGYGQVVTTKVHYVVDDRTTRTFVIDGEPERITFEPGTAQVLERFVRQGIDLLTGGVDFLLLAICLAAVARASGNVGTATAAVFAGQALTVILSVAGLLNPSPSALLVCTALAASAVVVVAILDVASPTSRWLAALCLAFGVMNGADLGARLVREWAFAGTHGITALSGAVATVWGGEVWVVALLWSAAGLIRRRGRVADLAVLSLAIFAGHAALHRIIDQGQALDDAGTLAFDRFAFTLTVGWAVVILCAGIAGTVISRSKNARPQSFAGTPRNSEAR